MKKTSKILSVIMVLALLVVSMMVSTVSVSAEDTVVLEWDFKTVEDGKVIDKSGNGNDGVIGSGVTVDAENGVATFAGGNQGIQLPDTVFSTVGTVTIEITFTPTKFEQYQTILGIGESDDPGWAVMTLMADGAVRYVIGIGGDGGAQRGGNSTNADPGSNRGGILDQSEEALTVNEEVTVTYVIEEYETTVLVNGEMAIEIDTDDYPLLADLDGPIVLGKGPRWPDPSFQGTITNFKITISVEDKTPATEEPADPTDEPEATETATQAPATTAPATSAPATSAPASATPADQAQDNGEFPIWIIAVIVVVVVAAVAAGVIVMKKKKK